MSERRNRVNRRLSVAPMMEWTDRHCRHLHRLLSRRTLLYTEMVPAAAVVHGPRARLLERGAGETPVALQLGGGEPALLAEAVRAALPFGYDEINLNVGCPSDRVRTGAFGACLMREPERVAACCAAMIEAAGEGPGPGPEITVKSRIGVDDQEPRDVLPAFLETVAAAGVRSFTIHARKAWLKGLSPKENRDVPPLDYPLVLAMKRARPDLEIIVNGGVGSLAEAEAHLAAGVDGVMIGRAAYHAPWDVLGQADARLFDDGAGFATPEDVVRAMAPYIEAEAARGVRMHAITRHMLGLFSGRPGARAWRRRLSEISQRGDGDPAILLEAAPAL